MFRRLGQLVVVAVVLVPVVPAHAQPPKLDVPAAIAALTDQRVYVAAGAVARFDEARVRTALPANGRVLVTPFTSGRYEDEYQYRDEVIAPLITWVRERGVTLFVVEGLLVSRYTWPPDRWLNPEHSKEYRHRTLRQAMVAGDVTEQLLVLAREAGGPASDVTVAPVGVAPPTGARVAEVAAALANEPVYNAPDRTDPIDPALADGRDVRVAAFPPPPPGAPVLDYAPALARLFPDDLVVVAHGRWLDVAGEDRAAAEYARDYAYGVSEDAVLFDGQSTNTVLAAMLDRLDEKMFTRPVPPPLGNPGLRAAGAEIGRVVPWVLVGVGAAICGVALYGWRRRRSWRGADERWAMRVASAEAAARISELGARVFDGATPEAAERFATARLLYDQALTSEAMANVAQVADEGLAQTAGGALPGPPVGAEPRPSPLPAPSLGETKILLRGLLVLTAIVSALIGISFATAPLSEEKPDRAATVADGLMRTSVYVEPGAPAVLDADRARRLVGDRPILVAVLRDDASLGSDDDARFGLCYSLVTSDFQTDIVIVFAPGPNGYGAELCTGYDFPGNHSEYDVRLVRDAASAARYLADEHDQGPIVQEVVHAFDARDGSVRLRRETPAGPPSKVGNVLIFSAVAYSALGTMLVFLLVRYIATRRTGRVDGTGRRHSVNARLNAVAEKILHPEPARDVADARRQADEAARYVRALHDFEKARTDAELSEVERKLVVGLG